MKTKIALSLLALFFIIGCTPGSTDSSGNVNESSQASGESSSTTSSVISSHNQGRACLDCHGSGGEESFESGGTVYTALNATTSAQYANGYLIRLVLENGQQFNYRSGRGTGNSYSNDSRMLSYRFTAQVVDSGGNVVNSSLDYSHNNTRVDCNTCHTSTGNNGAPGRITTAMPSVTPPTDPTPGTTTTTSGVFQSTVLPVLMATCSSTNCHGGGNGGRLTVTPDANATYTSIMAFSGVDTANAQDSLLLTKASNTVVHGGGIILLTTEAKYITIRDWIASGAALGAVTTTTTGTVNTASYASYVYPTLTNRCTTCHSSGSGRGFIVSTSAATYSNLAAYINKTSPAGSLILTKNNGTVSHSGGRMLTTAESANIEAWIAAGALNN